MSLIDVKMENGEVMLARIVDVLEHGYEVQFLVPTRSEDYYRFEKDVTFIEYECVDGTYDTDDITAAGYAEEVAGLYSRIDEDEEDYEDDDECDEYED